MEGDREIFFFAGTLPPPPPPVAFFATPAAFCVDDDGRLALALAAAAPTTGRLNGPRLDADAEEEGLLDLGGIVFGLSPSGLMQMTKIQFVPGIYTRSRRRGRREAHGGNCSSTLTEVFFQRTSYVEACSNRSLQFAIRYDDVKYSTPFLIGF